MTEDNPLGFKTNPILMRVSQQTLDAAQILRRAMDAYQDMTPAQRQRLAEKLAREQKAALKVKQDQHAALHDRFSTTMAGCVVLLHEPDKYGCTGCDYSGWESEAPDWPCRTIQTLVKAVGLTDIGELTKDNDD